MAVDADHQLWPGMRACEENSEQCRQPPSYCWTRFVRPAIAPVCFMSLSRSPNCRRYEACISLDQNAIVRI